MFAYGIRPLNDNGLLKTLFLDQNPDGFFLSPIVCKIPFDHRNKWTKESKNIFYYFEQTFELFFSQIKKKTFIVFESFINSDLNRGMDQQVFGFVSKNMKTIKSINCV